MPEMSVRCEITAAELISAAEEEIEELDGNWSISQHAAILKYIDMQNGIVELTMNWSTNLSTTGKFNWEVRINGALEKMLEAAKTKDDALTKTTTVAKDVIAAFVKIESSTASEENEKKFTYFDSKQIAGALHSALPTSTLFNPESGLLPNTVDIDEKFSLVGSNRAAALNYLQIANLDLKSLLKMDRRERQFLLSKAREKISKDFNLFWTQTIGKNRKLEISCEIENYGADAGEKMGKPHLIFGISDGHSMLYPKQRSEGVRWFVSFYLQLKASQARGLRRIFLMDEPGANLHPKAQEDVLRLVNTLSDTIDIIYSTHSGALLEFSKLYRVHAVQRVGEDDDSPTEIIDAHSLSAASIDTLTPLLMAMGTDLSSQNVIKKEDNVLLEEISGFYYFNAFWKLRNCQKKAHFIAATGASNIPTLANMFTGWGLHFIVVIDDDTLGRTVYKQLKQELCADDENISSAKLWKIKDCWGIEDVFSTIDFCKYILQDENSKITGKNTEYLKTAKRSKPVMAYQFWSAVQDGTLNSTMLEESTIEKIDEIVTEVCKRLESKTSLRVS
ncbi:hypothetical protein VCH24_41980 [Variovorax boronicumulans]|nr:hypothetical protein VCH24_41980 [Variovorax boronicumulans]